MNRQTEEQRYRINPPHLWAGFNNLKQEHWIDVSLNYTCCHKYVTVNMCVQNAKEKQGDAEQAGTWRRSAQTTPAAEAERKTAAVSMHVRLRCTGHWWVELQWGRHNWNCIWRQISSFLFLFFTLPPMLWCCWFGKIGIWPLVICFTPLTVLGGLDQLMMMSCGSPRIPPASIWPHPRCDVLRKGILRKLSLCYSIVYYYSGAQLYEQCGRLHQA